jgi:hypothetical protein
MGLRFGKGSSVSKTICKVVRFGVFTAVTMKNGVFWDVTPCGFCKSRLFGGTELLLHQGDKNRLLVTASVVPSSSILVILMKEVLISSEKSVLVFLRSVRRLLLTASVLISPILVTLMKEVLISSETSVLVFLRSVCW